MLFLFSFFADGASLISRGVPVLSGRCNWNFLVFLENLGALWVLMYKHLESKLLSRKKEVAYK